MNIKCQLCEKNFETSSGLSNHIKKHKIKFKDYYDKFLKLDGEGFCVVCGNVTTFEKRKYHTYCSSKCFNVANKDKLSIKLKEVYQNQGLRDKISQNVKIGLANRTTDDKFKANEKRIETCLKTYGKNNVSQTDNVKLQITNTWLEKSDEELKVIQHKHIKTCLKRYGVEAPLQCKAILNTVQQTNLKRYGFITAAKNEEVKKKISITKLSIGYEKIKDFSNTVLPLFAFDEYTGGGFEIFYQWMCLKCNTSFSASYEYICPSCPTCFPKQKSNAENEIIRFVSKFFNIEKTTHRRLIIPPQELDLYIPEKNVAIEYDGLYWHGEYFGNKNKKYHIGKTTMCNKLGIQLIHIFEDEWENKTNIVKNRLKNILGLIKYKIFARKCEIKEIDVQVKNNFLNKYHLQGKDISCINLGAFYKNRLVSVMTFSKLRKALGQIHKENYYELSRFCSIANFNIVGGASKLLAYFEKIYNPVQIVSYADQRWSNGGLYYKLGFNLDHISKPNYWYLPVGGKRRLHRFNFRKNVLKDKLKVFDPNISEWENMKANGYDRIWDCGSLVFNKNYPRKNLAGSTSANP